MLIGAGAHHSYGLESKDGVHFGNQEIIVRCGPSSRSALFRAPRRAPRLRQILPSDRGRICRPLVHIGVLRGITKQRWLGGTLRPRSTARCDQLLQPRETSFGQDESTSIVGERDGTEEAENERQRCG